MWAINQYSTRMINLDNVNEIAIWEEEEGKDIYSIRFDLTCLGKYIGLDRTVQVMQMICDSIKGLYIDEYGMPVSEKILSMPKE